MAMLAERKSKRKWCLNPNGKDWSEDNAKFGQKMLEKMGWKKGCGLGINLQGQKEHVKVSVKNDIKGLGCDANSDLEWLNHQDNYNNLLSELSSAIGDGLLTALESSSGKSLEDKSKTSRARVHYKKFVRGKDVSRYSGTDLMCILGKTEGVSQKRPGDDVENEVLESNSEINQKKMKKKKKNKSDDRCDEELVEEHSNDTTFKYEMMEYSERDLVVIRKTESVSEETRVIDVLENKVAETNCKTSKKKNKRKGNEELVEESPNDREPINEIMGSSDTDSIVVGKTESVTETRLADLVENKIPETNCKTSMKKKKKKNRVEESENGPSEEFVEASSENKKSKRKKCDDTVDLSSSGATAWNEAQETNDVTRMKMKKKNSSEEIEDGRIEELVEASPEIRKSKRKTSVSSKTTAEEIQSKYNGDEISALDSFSSSNLHEVKGYNYIHR